MAMATPDPDSSCTEREREGEKDREPSGEIQAKACAGSHLAVRQEKHAEAGALAVHGARGRPLPRRWVP